MKKIVLILIIGCIAAVAVFAQSYTVQSVTGRVELEKGGNRVTVKEGDTLTAEAVIHTGIGASMVLKDGEKTITIGAARNGKLAELAAGAASGVRIGGNVARTDTSAVSRTTGQVSTASARASDAAQDEDIAAE
ncbi:MAG: hypothetical protein LBH44_06410 [Treponema sp.]|jgi:hypothetical protein|nr:hypothetical protein [Treponema sp.]